jgi:UDP-N-acetylmuramyl pentapeptide synthase
MKNKLLNVYYHILAFFARKYIKRHNPYVIGINGSVGKTSCRMIISQTLKKFLTKKKIYTSTKNFNGEL